MATLFPSDSPVTTTHATPVKNIAPPAAAPAANVAAPVMPLAIDALIPDDLDRSNEGSDDRNSQHGPPAHIDYNKYRTRLCHYFLVQKPCPFADRCAFAHGEDQMNTLIPAATVERVFAHQHSHNQNGHHTAGGHYGHHSQRYFGGYSMRPNMVTGYSSGQQSVLPAPAPTSPAAASSPYSTGSEARITAPAAAGVAPVGSPLSPLQHTAAPFRPSPAAAAPPAIAFMAARHSHYHTGNNGATMQVHQTIQTGSNVTRVNSMSSDSALPTFAQSTSVAKESPTALPPPPAYTDTHHRLAPLSRSSSNDLSTTITVGAVRSPCKSNSVTLASMFSSEDYPAHSRYRYDPYSASGFVVASA